MFSWPSGKRRDEPDHVEVFPDQDDLAVERAYAENIVL
jgi:hypothetical protein